MSVNDKVKVLWKTKCHWRDRPHWPKRKEMKLAGDDAGEEKELSSLKPGDLVKVKFCSRWYDAEVCEPWEPRQSKKGKKSAPNACEVSEVPANDQHVPVEEMPTVADPYARFVLGQKKREAEWNANRAAKRARPTEIEIDNSENGTMPTVVEPPTVTEPPTGSIPPTHQLDELKRQLEEKNRDCEALTKKVEELQEASQLVAERQLLVSEKFCKVIEKVERAMVSLEGRMTASLERIEERLDRLEAVPNNPAPIPWEAVPNNPAPIPCEVFSTDDSFSPANTSSTGEIVNESLDLTTIDADALIRLQALQDIDSSLSPVVPYAVPQQSVPDSPCPVTDELIRSCVTPRKVAKVREALQCEKQRHRCAVRLLPYFFTKEELATCNTEGTYEKPPLDRTRLHSLKGNALIEQKGCPLRESRLYLNNNIEP
ncbi:hypothetical protein ACROYT_G015363 [Oculina patagonica]